MYKRVLVAIDGSAVSARALREATGLAKEQKSRLRVLNVVDDLFLAAAPDAYPMPNIGELTETLRAAGEKAVDAASAVARKQGLKVEGVVLEGGGKAIADVILDEADRWSADLIVMGTHGRRGLDRMLLGSDAERVVRNASAPVLLVKGEESRIRGRKRRVSARKRPPRPAG